MKNYSQELGLNHALVPKKERYIGEVCVEFKHKKVTTNYYSNWNYMNFAMMDLISYLFINKVQNIYYKGSIPKDLNDRLEDHKIRDNQNIKERLNNPTWDLDLQITDENIRLHPLFKDFTSKRCMDIVLNTSKSRFDLIYGLKVFTREYLPLTRKHCRIDNSNIFDIVDIDKKRNNNKYHLDFNSYLGRAYSYNIHAFNTHRQPANFYNINHTCQHAIRFLSTFRKPWILEYDDFANIFKYTGNERYVEKQIFNLLDGLKTLRIIRGYSRKIVYEIW